MNEKFLEEALQAIKSGHAIIASGRARLKEGDLILTAIMQLGAFTKAQALAQIALVQAQQDLVRQQQIANKIALSQLQASGRPISMASADGINEAIGNIKPTESEAQK